MFYLQKGTPWECRFSLHSATTDTAHVRWFSHCFATTDNFCLVFLQWLNTSKIKKKNKTRNQKKTKCQDPTLCHYSPPWGVHFFCFFFVSPKEEYSYSEGYVCFEYCICWQFLLGFSTMAKHKQNQKKQNTTKPPPKKKTKCHDPTLCHYSPPRGVHFFLFLFVSPKEEYSYSEGYVCFEYCICWQVWGCCNYVEVV